jgi:hypothetical protein
MMDEGSAKGLEAAFQKNWEKLAIGVVLVAAVIYLGARFAAGTPAEEAAVVTMVVAVKKAEGDRNSNIPAPSSFKRSSESAQIAPVRPLDFTHCYKTKYEGDYEKVPLAEVAFVIPIVKLESATASFEGVDLVWSLTEVKPDGLVRGQHVVDPKTFYFQVERRTKDEAWKAIESKLRFKDNKDMKYRDSKTHPKTDYEYRVTLGSDEKKWTDKNPKGLVSRPSETVAARTSSIFAYKFDNYQRFDEEDPPKPATVYITITKHDPVAGQVEIRYTHTEGDKIGWKKDDKDKPTSKHRVFSNKLRRNVEVDFNSGAVLKKIGVGKIVRYKYKECQRKVGPEGPTCDGPIEKEDKYFVNEVEYLDEENNLVKDQRPTGAGPRGDQLCEDHGGAPPPVREEKPAADREQIAEKLLKDADGLWNSAKPSDQKKAQKMYKELLEKYADTEILKFRKAQIDDRAKQAIK